MSFVNVSVLWSFCYFIPFLYTSLIFTLVIYLVPVQGKFTSSSVNSLFKSNFFFISFVEIFNLLCTPVLLFILLNLLWSSTTTAVWFGHLVFTPFSQKMIYIISFMFFLITLLFASTSYLNSQEISDYVVVTNLFYFWVNVLFFTNSAFTIIFVIEILSTLVFLLIITSSHSSNFYYNNLDISSFNYKSYSFPFNLLQSILFFFWISLVASLCLFLFLLLLYLKVVTFDWFVLEFVFLHLIETRSFKEVYSLGFVWFFLLIAIFIKCGLTPFYLWKPVFFKGLYFSSLVFYVCFYYVFLFIFLITTLSLYFHEVFTYFYITQLFLLLISLTSLIFILCETFFIRSFVAISSILNSVLVLLALNTIHLNDWLVWL